MRKITAAILFGALLTCFAPQAHAGDTAQVGAKAPDFELVDLNGKNTKLSDFKGKMVVLEWFNSECPFVKKHYKPGNMQKLQSESMADGVVWLTINSSKKDSSGFLDTDAAKSKLDEWNSKPTAYLTDESGKVGKLYGAKTTPHMYVINTEGTLVYAGAIDSTPSTKSEDIEGSTNYVRQALSETKAGKSVSVASTAPYGCSVKYAS